MLKKIITEFVGTFIFLSVILATGDPLAIGLSLAVAIYFGIKISGGHFNPAVSIMMYFKKAINNKELACYIISQVLGGIVAYFGLADLHGYLPYFLVLAASSFIYIAVADLIPTLHKKTDMQSSLKQIALIAVGVTVICLLHTVAHDFEEQMPVVNMQTSLMLS